MEKTYGLQGGLILKKKLIWSHSIRESWLAYELFSRSFYIAEYIYIFTDTFGRSGCGARLIFKRNLISLNSEFTFSKTGCLIMAKGPHLMYYLSIDQRRMIGFIYFTRVLELCEMLSCPFCTRIIITPRIPFSASTTRHTHKHTHTNIHIYFEG